MSFLIDELRVSAFRGIPNEVRIDCTAPLTLIYAPNGTGKTSLCRSLEWLVSEREDNYAPCKFAVEGTSTEVEIKLAGQSDQRVSRTHGGDRTIDASRVSFGGFLKHLAPEYLIQADTAKTANARLISFIKSTRILSGETLSTLIDDSPEALSAREHAFADLTDTSDLLDLRRKIDVYSAELRKARLMHENTAVRIDRELSSLAHSPTTEVEPVELWLERTRSLLGSSAAVDTTDLSGELDRLRLQVSTASARLTADQSAATQLMGLFVDRQPPQARVAAMEAPLAQTRQEADKARALRDQIQAEKADCDASLVRLKSELGKIRDIRQIIGRIAELLDGTIASDLTVNALARPNEMQRFESSTRALARLEELRPSLLGWAAREESLRRTETELAEAKSQPKLDLSALQQAKNDLETDIKQIEVELEGLNTLTSHFQSLATSWIESSLESAECPACGHSWPSNEQLAAAISRTAETTPATVRRLTDAKLHLTQKVNVVARQQKLGADLMARTEALSAKLESEVGELDNLRKSAALFGLKDAEGITEAVLSRIDIALRAAELIDDLKVSLQGAGFANDLLDSTVEQVHEETVRLLTERTQAQQSQEKKAVELESDLNSRAKSVAGLDQVAKDLRRAFTEAKVDEEAAIHLAKSLQLGSEISWNSVGKAAARIESERSRVAQMTEYLRIAAAGLENGKALTRKAELEAEKSTLKTWIDQILREEQQASNLGADLDMVAAERRRVSFGPLLAAINQMFGRMQANWIVDHLSLNELGRSFAIEGMSAGIPLSPEGHFSQGQRQDLALAMFLVRAYSLGGSFILDEPLSHLDDLNRVALIDTLRAFVLEVRARKHQTRLVITTASWALTRHFVEKFLRIDRISAGLPPALRVYQLSGTARTSVTASQLFPLAEQKLAAPQQTNNASAPSH